MFALVGSAVGRAFNAGQGSIPSITLGAEFVGSDLVLRDGKAGNRRMGAPGVRWTDICKVIPRSSELPARVDHYWDDGAGRRIALALGDVFLEHCEVRDLPLSGFVLHGERKRCGPVDAAAGRCGRSRGPRPFGRSAPESGESVGARGDGLQAFGIHAVARGIRALDPTMGGSLEGIGPSNLAGCDVFTARHLGDGRTAGPFGWPGNPFVLRED